MLKQVLLCGIVLTSCVGCKPKPAIDLRSGNVDILEGNELKNNSLTELEKKSVAEFFNAYTYVKNANKLMKNVDYSNLNSLSEEIRLIIGSFDSALTRIRECDFDVLNGLHAEWGDMCKDNFVPAVNLYKVAFTELANFAATEGTGEFDQSGVEIKVAKGDAYFALFNKWLELNISRIGERVGD